MDVSKFLSCIEIQTDNEEQLRKFLIIKEEDIKTEIIRLWEEYKSIIPDTKESVVIEPNTLKDDISTFSNPIIADLQSGIGENSPNTIIIETNSVPPRDSTIPRTKSTPEGSGNNTINTTSLVESVIPKEPLPKQPELPAEKKINDAFDLQIKNKSIILPNGKANQSYKFVFKIEDLGILDIGDFWFEGIDKIGLTYNPDSNEISGTPLIAGEHKIILKIKRNDWNEGKPIFEREFIIIINPDPKTLWKNLPAPLDIEYFKQDCAKNFVKVEGTSLLGFGKSHKKDMVAASQRGRSHAQEGKPRDDDFRLKYTKEGWYILTVADGAGSAKYSRKGSEIACRTVIESCENLIGRNLKEFEHHIKEYNTNKTDIKKKIFGDSLYEILGRSVFKSLKKIEEEAKLSNKPIKDFSTTLIVAICKKFKFGWFVGAFWVGDGGIGIYNKELQIVKVLGESDSGEFAGQTRFLTMPEITESKELYRRLRFEIVEDFTAMILMTDGITDPKFETDANLIKVEKWNDLWKDLESEVDFSDNNKSTEDQLLKWLDFWSPGNHDDRTIAILF